MGYIAVLLLGLFLYSYQVKEIVITPEESTIKVGDTIRLEAKGLYGIAGDSNDERIADIKVDWKCEGDGKVRILFLDDSRIKIIAEEEGIVQVEAEYGGLKDYAIVTIK